MTDQPPPSRSSLLYAMGHLQAETAGNTNEIVRLRDQVAALPSQVAALMQPQIVTINATLESHGQRIGRIERRLLVASGAVAVILTLIELGPPVAQIMGFSRGGP